MGFFHYALGTKWLGELIALSLLTSWILAWIFVGFYSIKYSEFMGPGAGPNCDSFDGPCYMFLWLVEIIIYIIEYGIYWLFLFDNMGNPHHVRVGRLFFYGNSFLYILFNILAGYSKNELIVCLTSGIVFVYPVVICLGFSIYKCCKAIGRRVSSELSDFRGDRGPDPDPEPGPKTPKGNPPNDGAAEVPLEAQPPIAILLLSSRTRGLELPTLEPR